MTYQNMKNEIDRFFPAYYEFGIDRIVFLCNADSATPFIELVYLSDIWAD